jgi:hypothetical protein
MDFRTNWGYKRAADRAGKDTNYDARSFLTMVALIGFPLGLLLSRQMPGMLLGAFLLPLPIIYYLTFFRWNAENRRSKQGFGPLAKVAVERGILHLDDGKSRTDIDLEDIRELAVFIPK